MFFRLTCTSKILIWRAEPNFGLWMTLSRFLLWTVYKERFNHLYIYIYETFNHPLSHSIAKSLVYCPTQLLYLHVLLALRALASHSFSRDLTWKVIVRADVGLLRSVVLAEQVTSCLQWDQEPVGLAVSQAPFRHTPNRGNVIGRRGFSKGMLLNY